MTKKDKEYRKQLLLRFIRYYLSKPTIKMKDLLTNLEKSLVTKGKITRKQLEAILKFLERERPFKNKDRDEIVDYFGHLVVGYSEGKSNDFTTTIQFE